jgi:hypothetical protein
MDVRATLLAWMAFTTACSDGASVDVLDTATSSASPSAERPVASGVASSVVEIRESAATDNPLPPSPVWSALAREPATDKLPTSLRTRLQGCWKLPSGEEWRIAASGKEGLSVKQRMPLGFPRHLLAKDAAQIRFAKEGAAISFTSLSGAHPCLIACTLDEKEAVLRCDRACSRRPDDGYPIRARMEDAHRCETRP